MTRMITATFNKAYTIKKKKKLVIWTTRKHNKNGYSNLIQECRAPPLFSDNMSALHLATNPVFHARIIHIKIAYRFVRENVALVLT